MSTETIQPKPLSEVVKTFGGYLGKDPCADRTEIVELINEFREGLYIDPDIPSLFKHKFYCVKPCCFPMDCSCSCDCGSDTYMGFTLPSDLDGIEDAWEDLQPLKLRSSWWEGRTCRESKSTPNTMSVTDTGASSPTRRILPKAGGLVFAADCKLDFGKELTLNYTDCFGDSQQVGVTLDEVTDTEEDVFGIESVVLPSLEGNVRIMTDDGFELSTYTRYDERVPQYRVFKVNTGACGCDRILIRGAQKFMPICFDDDIVEVGSSIILREAANVLKYGREGTDAGELARAQLAKRQMIKYIEGATDRKLASSKNDGNVLENVFRQTISSCDLDGYKAKGCNC